MARNKSRSSLWGTARRAKVTTKMGSPGSREGSDGDLEVRNTSLGSRLFAKIGGRWLSNRLHGSELDNPNVHIPKIAHLRRSSLCVSLTEMRKILRFPASGGLPIVFP